MTQGSHPALLHRVTFSISFSTKEKRGARRAIQTVPLARHTTRRGVRGYGEPALPLAFPGGPGASRRLHDDRSPRSAPVPWIIERLRVSPGLTSISGHAPRSPVNLNRPLRAEATKAVGRLFHPPSRRGVCCDTGKPAAALRFPPLAYRTGFHACRSVACSRLRLLMPGVDPQVTIGRSYLAPCPAYRIAHITGPVPAACGRRLANALVAWCRP